MARADKTEELTGKRVRNFAEISHRLTKKQAVEQARLIPQSVHDTWVSPLKVDRSQVIRLLREVKITEALEKIREENFLPGITARLAPEKETERPDLPGHGRVSIRALEQFIFDNGRPKFLRKTVPHKHRGAVAVVGSGASGLMTAADLIRRGFKVIVYEAAHRPGGRLRMLAPPFRLPRPVLDYEIRHLESVGAEFVTDCVIGKTVAVGELFRQGFQAVVLCVGLVGGRPCALDNARAPGVISAEEFLIRVNVYESYRYPQVAAAPLVRGQVAVIGEDDTALDAARAAVRMGREVRLLHGGLEENLAGRPEWLRQAKEEGVRIESLTKAKGIVCDQHGRLAGVRCVKMDFTDPGETGEWEIKEVRSSEYIVAADSVICALGPCTWEGIEKVIPGLKTTKQGTLWTSKGSGMTSIPGVFAAGSAVVGRQDLLSVLLSAKKTAEAMDLYIKLRK